MRPRTHSFWLGRWQLVIVYDVFWRDELVCFIITTVAVTSFLHALCHIICGGRKTKGNEQQHQTSPPSIRELLRALYGGRSSWPAYYFHVCGQSRRRLCCRCCCCCCCFCGWWSICQMFMIRNAVAVALWLSSLDVFRRRCRRCRCRPDTPHTHLLSHLRPRDSYRLWALALPTCEPFITHSLPCARVRLLPPSPAVFRPPSVRRHTLINGNASRARVSLAWGLAIMRPDSLAYSIMLEVVFISTPHVWTWT